MSEFNIKDIHLDACGELHDSRKSAVQWRWFDHGADYQLDSAISNAEAAVRKLRKIRKHLKKEMK